MFPKGPRFEPLKVPDVPGPNAYNIPQDSALENYKRGAFLEKTDRFMKDKQPIPLASGNKPSSAPSKGPTSQPPIERYNALQRKVDDLEKVHLEGKRIHQIEQERLKQELSAAIKSSSDSAERYEKQKKQNALLDARIQELKKTNMSDQSELKELRHKARMLELERDKISSKQPEITELKKSLSVLEAKRRDELKERDRRIVELEKLLQSEKKRRELSESKVQESKRLLEEETSTIKAANLELEALVNEARSEAQIAKEKLNNVENEVVEKEGVLVRRLEQHCHLLNAVAEQYGNLVSQSVASHKYKRLQQDHDALQFRVFRLERKLANSEGQVVELTHLIRQIKSENIHLTQLVSDTMVETSLVATFDHSLATRSDSSFWLLLDDVRSNVHEQTLCLAELDASMQKIFSAYYHMKSNELHATSSTLLNQYMDTQTLAEQRALDLSSVLASHEAIAARLESIQKEKAENEEKLKTTTSALDNLTATVAVLETQLVESQEELHTSALQHAILLKKDKDAMNRLTLTVQKNRVAEDALRAEIEQLSAGLVEAERYEEAYYGLYNEVETLLTRNQIAEEEADRISKFNAEILGHNNPAQRIMYVDRIRRELAEAKHKIAMLSREQENVVAQNDDLQHELDMYKSVGIPFEKKPRTNITRVLRPPLVNMGNSLNSSHHTQAVSVSKYAFELQEPLLEVNHGDMTTDELM